MFRKTLWLSLLIPVVFFLPGCATIMHGSRQSMILTCEPRIASVYVDGNYIGHTPMNAVLSRGKDHCLRVELPGYKPFETVLTRKLDGWLFGNILLPGIAIDAVSGSMYRLSPKNIYPELTPLPAAGATGSSALSIRLVLQPDPEWEKIGDLTVLANGVN